MSKEESQIRTSFFGGYNTKDVTEHIEKLEEIIKNLEEENKALMEDNAEKSRILEKSELAYRALWEKSVNQGRILSKQKEAVSIYEKALYQCAEVIRELKKEKAKLSKELRKKS